VIPAPGTDPPSCHATVRDRGAHDLAFVRSSGLPLSRGSLVFGGLVLLMDHLVRVAGSDSGMGATAFAAS
jgi:hypothetical protein